MSDWRERAACAGMDTEIFFQPEEQGRGDKHTKTDPHAQARAVCAVCPVIAQCLKWYTDNHEQGFAGGMSTQERANARRQTQRPPQARLPVGRPVPADIEQARQDCYDSGLSDGEIAKALDTTKETIRSWRRARKLPSNVAPTQRLPREDLYASGLTDRQISEELKCTSHAIKSWRQKRGYPVHVRGGLVQA